MAVKATSPTNNSIINSTYIEKRPFFKAVNRIKSLVVSFFRSLGAFLYSCLKIQFVKSYLSEKRIGYTPKPAYLEELKRLQETVYQFEQTDTMGQKIKRIFTNTPLSEARQKVEELTSHLNAGKRFDQIAKMVRGYEAYKASCENYGAYINRVGIYTQQKQNETKEIDRLLSLDGQPSPLTKKAMKHEEILQSHLDQTLPKLSHSNQEFKEALRLRIEQLGQEKKSLEPTLNHYFDKIEIFT